jgi:predicted dehydrogenase
MCKAALGQCLEVPGLRVAVVGLGYWGPNHVRNLLSLSECTAVIAVDKDGERAHRLARSHPGVIAADRLEVALDDPEVQAVVISTPVDTHTALAERVLDAGKSVLVEKPMATSAAAAQALVDKARSAGLLATAGHTFLFSPPVLTIRDLIDRGELGELLYLQGSRVNLGIHSADVSVLWDLAPHDLSILLHWVQEAPTCVSATGRASHSGHPPDVAFIDVEFGSGFVANLHLSWLAPTKIRRMTLVGNKRMVVYEDTHPEEPVKIYDKGVELARPEDFGEYRLTYRTGDVISPRVPVWEPLRRELEQFLQRVLAHEVPDAREDTIIQVLAVIEAAEASLRAGGAPVSL